MTRNPRGTRAWSSSESLGVYTAHVPGRGVIRKSNSEAVLRNHNHRSARVPRDSASLCPRHIYTLVQRQSGDKETHRRSPAQSISLPHAAFTPPLPVVVRASVGAAAPNARCKGSVLWAFPGEHEVGIAFYSSSSSASLRTSGSDPTVRRRFPPCGNAASPCTSVAELGAKAHVYSKLVVTARFLNKMAGAEYVCTATPSRCRFQGDVLAPEPNSRLHWSNT